MKYFFAVIWMFIFTYCAVLKEIDGDIEFHFISQLHASQVGVKKGSKQLFDVRHSVEYVRLIEPYQATGRGVEFNFSPDGHHVIYATSEASVNKQTILHTVWIHSTNDIAQYLNTGSLVEAPRARRLIIWQTSKDMDNFGYYMRPPYLHGFRWSRDSKYIFFIGKKDKEPDQVYKVDVLNGKLAQVTNSKYPIKSFALNNLSSDLVYVALVPVSDSESDRTAELVAEKQLTDILCNDCATFNRLLAQPTLFLKKLNSASGNKDELLSLPSGVFLASGNNEVWLSPDAKYVIVLAFPPAGKVWDHIYSLPENPELNSSGIRGLSVYRYSSKNFRRHKQFYMIDVINNKAFPIIDSPSSALVKDVHWSEDGSRLIFGPTFLPIDGVQQSEVQKRKSTSYIAELILKNMTLLEIREINGDGNEEGSEYIGIGIIDDNNIIMRSPRGEAGRRDDVLHRTQNTWILRTGRDDVEIDRGVKLFIKQDLNVSPDIYAKTANGGVEKLVHKLNPGLDNVIFGHAEQFNWNDKEGGEWQGAVVYPVNYQHGKRYPLVIQTRSYTPGEFILNGDGDVTAPFAARALASKGIMVLQMGTMPSNMRFESVADTIKILRRGVEAGIESLYDIGIIDKKRVGITGWSYTGIPVQSLITFSNYEISSAIIADAYGPGMVSYANTFGYPVPSMHYLEHMYGGSHPWGEKLLDWVKNNPVFHLDRVRTPLLLQQFVPGGLIAWWDIYAILRRVGNPVEMWQYPDSDHVPSRPDQQFHALEVAIDWHAFWLAGKIDQTPHKKERYERWIKEKTIMNGERWLE